MGRHVLSAPLETALDARNPRIGICFGRLGALALTCYAMLLNMGD
jgi:hypothetical protein